MNDCDNVLYEITNEDTAAPPTPPWQTHLIAFIKEYEAAKPKQHPVGMTVAVAGRRGRDPASESRRLDLARQTLARSDGRKVILNDTDHSFFWIGLK